MKAQIKDLLAHVDLWPVVAHDIPALGGTFNGRYSREVACPKCGGKTRLRFRLCEDGLQRIYCSHCAEQGLNALDYIMWRDGVDFKTALRWWNVSPAQRND